MTAILVTGSTGFLGSEFIAEALLRGTKVIALARNDHAGNRVLDVVKQIFIEKQSPPPDFSKLLTCINFNGDLNELLISLKSLHLPIRAVYHIAANMSYAPKRVVKSFEINQRRSVELYEFISLHFPETRNFFYVSTAYTAGVKPETIIKEELHLTPELVNSYQISKWAAEMSLSIVAKTSNVPLTIIRPSIIVGERLTGRYSGKSFGFYMFMKSFLSVKVLGIKKIRLDMSPESHINLISVVDVVNSLLALAESGTHQPILHLTCSQGTQVGQIAKALKEAWDFEVIFSTPESLLDKLVDKQIKPNKEFAQFGKWNFEMNGDGPKAREFSVDELKILLIYFEKNFSRGLKLKFMKSMVSQMFSLKF
jgi:nucleoside-diphosphate-sugar epimerase